MKLSEIKLLESVGYSKLQEFVIHSWGRLLYLDYLALPQGTDATKDPAALKQLLSFITEYFEKDPDEQEEDDEWIAEGCPMKGSAGRTYLLGRATVDSILRSAQHKAGAELKLYRFSHTADQLKPGAWISLTKNPDAKYNGPRREFVMRPDSLIIDTRGLADEDEVIVNTDELLRLSDK